MKAAGAAGKCFTVFICVVLLPPTSPTNTELYGLSYRMHTLEQ